jgi:mRNA-degrading endonuclease toxin of MazEF toxin-antitoxin module
LVNRGDIADYLVGSRRIRVLTVSADAYNDHHPIIVMVHDRADGSVPGILLPLPPGVAGGGTVDLSRIRFADPSAFGSRLARATPTFMTRVDQGLRRLLGL